MRWIQLITTDHNQLAAGLDYVIYSEDMTERIGYVGSLRDAKLIEAAPDMLAFLRDLYDGNLTSWATRLGDLLRRVDS